MAFSISYYHDYISPELADYLLAQAKPVSGVPNLVAVGEGGGLETPQGLRFLCELYDRLEPHLKSVLDQRVQDRKFIDERVKACYEFNQRLNIDFLDANYKTVIGLEDAEGRIVVGPLGDHYCRAVQGKPIAPIPEYLQGSHVTLFGPPGTAKMAINAMNTYHRKIKGEPQIVEKLLAKSTSSPKWGADDEDSKTPLRSDLVSSAVNLTQCFEGRLSYHDEETRKKYELAKEKLSVPIKRFPGLALPSTFLFYKGNPIPLHLYDFALHLFKNWHNPQSLAFYVPKLENEEEAQYIHKMIATAELMISQTHPEYQLGSVRLMIVLENPRAILRTHEIIDALYPYFVGASLGWHDYLGSMARLFKEDANYRIPVKADPDIVIKYIKASHSLLADVVGSRGGIKVGGMYGILPLDNDIYSESFQVTIKGYIKDVITQMKRDLTGFWVAHPDFVRLGLALLEGWSQHAKGDSAPLFELVDSLLLEKHRNEIKDFILGRDIEGLDKNDPNYVRSLIVADIKESDFIPNNHPEEIRYNVFQSLQYITDWLSGNGCVALPAHVRGVAVRVMDDLATAERSRWEVWHEIYHKRFSIEEFIKIVFEEYHFIRKDLSDDKKIVQVKWDENTAKWYPIALHLMVQLMTSKAPVEFATELLMPFTVDSIRNSDNPLRALLEISPQKYTLDAYVERLIYYFEICGEVNFASEMARGLVQDLAQAQNIIEGFSEAQIIAAAHFHGDIGQGQKTLDSFASQEQSLVFQEEKKTLEELKKIGQQYLNKVGFKFLVSAKGKSGKELLQILKERIDNPKTTEIANARQALWEISHKRLLEKPLNSIYAQIEHLRQNYKVDGVSLAVWENCEVQGLGFGSARAKTWFELASLSKTLASAFSLEYFSKKNISLDTAVDEVLAKTASPFRLKNDKVTLRHLMAHSALNLHYITGYPLDKKIPPLLELLQEVKVVGEPGEKFQYSGGGYLLLEHIIESLESSPIQKITQNYYESLSFEQTDVAGIDYAKGFFDNGNMVPSGRLQFPAFAAGAMGTAAGMGKLLCDLTLAYQNLEGFGKISHDTAVQMLFGSDKGCRDFMDCDMGLGVFVAECGDNKLAIHQGANEGFRCLYISCVSGPDVGKGFVLLCNADTKGVFFNAEVAQLLLKSLNFSGIDFTKFANNFDYQNLPTEQVVNFGYKKLIFEAFQPTLPEEIKQHGPQDPLAPWNLLNQAHIEKVSNQRFARASNLISEYLPAFDAKLFGKQGKIMDSWESARHNPDDCDFVLCQLPKKSMVKYVHLSTKFHDGNQAEYVRILGWDPEALEYVELLPKQKMLGHAYLNTLSHCSDRTISKVKIEMYPDGGLSRVGLYYELPQGEQGKFTQTECRRYDEPIAKTQKPLSIKYQPTESAILRNQQQAPVDLASLAFGGKLLRASNEHYGPAIQVISPFPPINMFDGLESARSRDKNHFEEVIIALASSQPIQSIILDFTYFVNNNPKAVSIEAFDGKQWQMLVDQRDVKAYAANKIEFLIKNPSSFEQIKLKTFPDGGINRLHIY